MLLINEALPLYINNAFNYLSNLLYLSILIITANYHIYNKYTNGIGCLKILLALSTVLAGLTTFFVTLSYRDLLTFTAGLPYMSPNYLITNEPKWLKTISCLAVISLIITVITMFKYEFKGLIDARKKKHKTK